MRGFKWKVVEGGGGRKDEATTGEGDDVEYSRCSEEVNVGVAFGRGGGGGGEASRGL
jgi:hypothetical protein